MGLHFYSNFSQYKVLLKIVFQSNWVSSSYGFLWQFFPSNPHLPTDHGPWTQTLQIAGVLLYTSCTFLAPCVTSYLTFYQYVQPDRRKQEPWDRGRRNLRTHLPLITFRPCSLELLSTFCIVCHLLGYILRSFLTCPSSTILEATIRVNILEPTYNYAVPLLKIIYGSWDPVCLLSKAVQRHFSAAHLMHVYSRLDLCYIQDVHEAHLCASFFALFLLLLILQVPIPSVFFPVYFSFTFLLDDTYLTLPNCIKIHLLWKTVINFKKLELILIFKNSPLYSYVYTSIREHGHNVV